MLGGVRIAFDRGLDGFSDADVAAHALVDALLGAAALGDCGTHFPAGDVRYAGADGASLLRHSAGLLEEAGYRIANVDCTIVAEAPALQSHVTAMRSALARALNVDVSQVSVKAKRTEGLGFTGRGDGIAAYAIACIDELASVKK